MESSLLEHIKKQASSFIQNKYKNARLAFSDVTNAELLTEEATNNDPWGPDAKTMTKIAQSSYEIDDYWRIVDIVHKRFDVFDWKEWRQSYKALILLEFLLTHGPEEMAEEFQVDCDVIEELAKFEYIDDKGFNWGTSMQKRCEHVLQLLNGGLALKEARLKALKITKGIQGFGNVVVTSPTSTLSSPSSSSSDSSRSASSSFFSYSPNSSTSSDFSKDDDYSYSQRGSFHDKLSSISPNSKSKSSHVWNCPPIQETGSLLDLEDCDDQNDDDEDDECLDGCNLLTPKKYFGENDNFKSFSDVGRLLKKRYDRQFDVDY
ncbi:ENTH/VHS family protein [Euphorbia peplus]|nr:ENTH/VHS family protein [Euphorbia peplus]